MGWPTRSVVVQQLSNKRLWTGMDGMRIFRLGKMCDCSIGLAAQNLGTLRRALAESGVRTVRRSPASKFQRSTSSALSFSPTDRSTRPLPGFDVLRFRIPLPPPCDGINLLIFLTKNRKSLSRCNLKCHPMHALGPMRNPRAGPKNSKNSRGVKAHLRLRVSTSGPALKTHRRPHIGSPQARGRRLDRAAPAAHAVTSVPASASPPAGAAAAL
jgi:hypothetical protein